MLIAGATAGAASRGKRRMPFAQVTRSSTKVSRSTIGGGPQAEQQRCGQGRPVDAARRSSGDSPDESLCSARDRPSMPRTAAAPFVRGAQAFKCTIATREPLSATVSGSLTAMHDLEVRAID